MTPDALKALARRWFDAMSAGTLELVDDLFDADYELHFPDLPPGERGPGVIRQVVSGYRTAFPDLHFTVEQMVAEGDTLAVRWTAEGTQRGTLMGVAPTGQRARWTGMSMLRVRGDRIVEDWVQTDRLGMLQQLGISPAPTVGA